MLFFVVAYLEWARVLDSYGFLVLYSYFTVATNIIVIKLLSPIQGFLDKAFNSWSIEVERRVQVKN